MEQDKIYSWVKASKRLPKNPDDTNNQYRLNEMPVRGNFYNNYEYNLNGTVYFHVSETSTHASYNVKPDNFDRLEWLEEQTDKVAISKERYEAFTDLLETFSQEPYPTDIFPEITQDQLKQLHRVCLKEFGFPIDRLTGHVGRLLRNPLLEIAKPFLNQLKSTELKHNPSFEDMEDAVRQIS